MRGNSFLIGLAGGSGSGKTTLVRALLAQLPPGSACVVSQDDYYLPLHRQAKDANGRVNFDLPGALDLDQLAEDLERLSCGETLRRKEYAFEVEGAGERWLELRPAPVIIVEGLFLLQHERLRRLIDLKVYVEASEAVQLKRRIARDERERGYPLADVLYQWEHHVMPAYREHLLPYRHLCELVVRNEHRYGQAVDQICGHLAQHAGIGSLAGRSAWPSVQSA